MSTQGLSVIAQNIKRLRAAKGLTQNELAYLSGKASVAMIEAGRLRSPRMETMDAIAHVLGVTIADLYTEQPLELSGQG